MIEINYKQKNKLTYLIRDKPVCLSIDLITLELNGLPEALVCPVRFGEIHYFCITSPINGISSTSENHQWRTAGISPSIDSDGSNQQWALEYAGIEMFCIRSRHSALYLEEGEGSFRVARYKGK